MTATEKTLNEALTRLHADGMLARGTAPLYPQTSPLRDRLLVSMWSQQLLQMIDALHEWSWNDIYEYITKFGTIETTIFRYCDDADTDYILNPEDVVDAGFDALWARINGASLHSDNVEVVILDIPDMEQRLISHPNYPQFNLLVSVSTTVMYQSDDYFVHEFSIRYGGESNKK